MDNIVKLIKEAKSVAVISHINEDTDAFGSSLAMLKMLKSAGKDAVLYTSSIVEKRMSFWSCDYTVFNNEVSRHFELLICLDCGDVGRLGERACLLDMADKSINIDHHYTNTNFATENRVDGDMSSTCEMVYDLFVEMQADITPEIAGFLYGGIMGDTGCLKYSSATPKTVMTVAKLMETGFDHAELCRRLFDLEPVEVIKLKGHIMNNIESYYDNKVTLVTLDEKTLEQFGVGENDTGDIVNIPRSVLGTEIAVFIKQTKDKIKISLRSNGKYNVGEIALKLGGGGHQMAAGISLPYAEINDVKKQIITIIGESING